MNTQTFAHALENDPAVKARVEENLKAILDRSATDQAFRFKLLADSRAALAEFAGADISTIPEGAIRFAERTNETTIHLPPFVGSRELSEGDLETVAGGTDPITLTLVGILGVEVGVAAGLAILASKS